MPIYNIPQDRIKDSKIDIDPISDPMQMLYSRSSFWCVCFIPFNEPAAAYNKSLAGALATKNPIVIVNDCININVQNNKTDFIKSCSMIFKITDVNYQTRVANGDWTFVWIADNKEQIDAIAQSLSNGHGNIYDAIYNNWNSGLKFVGRVINVNSTDSMAGNGKRAYNTSINAQSFLEMATTIYLMQQSASILTSGQADLSSIQLAKALGRTVNTSGASSNKKLNKATFPVYKQYDSQLAAFYKNYAEKRSMNLPTCDVALLVNFIITMGLDTNSAAGQAIKYPWKGDKAMGAARGSFSDAIKIPRSVPTILGNPSANYLFELYNIYTGVLKYATKNKTSKPWMDFAPTGNNLFGKGGMNNREPIWKQSSIPLKGWIYYQMPNWEGTNIWQLLNTFLNPTINEMYTCLRCDEYNRIRPTIIARERPLGTNLFNLISNTKMSATSANVDISNAFNSSKVPSIAPVGINSKTFERAMFIDNPTWIIDDNMVLSYSVSTSEARRINCTVVWTTSMTDGINGTQVQDNIQNSPIETQKELQMIGGNWVTDDNDIARNGLRMDISTSNFDVPGTACNNANFWARMRADWLFNGHLKPSGTIHLVGIQEPICEGDNAQIRGVLFHIDAVTHNASIAANGDKIWTTTLSVSNGIIASSLLSGSTVPRYINSESNVYKQPDNMPATTYNYTSAANKEYDSSQTVVSSSASTSINSAKDIFNKVKG